MAVAVEPSSPVEMPVETALQTLSASRAVSAHSSAVARAATQQVMATVRFAQAAAVVEEAGRALLEADPTEQAGAMGAEVRAGMVALD